MTSISGNSIIKTPCCGTLFTTPRYSSINTSAQEYWSDGQRVKSHSLTDGNLRHCSCGQLFLLSQAQHVGMVAEPTPPKLSDGGIDDFVIPEHLRQGSKTPPPVEAVVNAKPAKLKLDRYDKPIPPTAPLVPDRALAALMSSTLLTDRDVETVVRRRYWRLLNDSYRDEYRTFKDSSARDSFMLLPRIFCTRKSPRVKLVKPLFKPTAEQEGNMLVLIELIRSQASPDWLEVAELHRELGEPAKALACLDNVTPDLRKVAAMQRSLIASGRREPVGWQ